MRGWTCSPHSGIALRFIEADQIGSFAAEKILPGYISGRAFSPYLMSRQSKRAALLI